MKYVKKRWVSLLFMIPISMCIGSIFSWSVFAVPLSREFDTSVVVVTFAFTIATSLSGVMNIFGGMLFDRFGARKILTISGIFYASGYIISGYSGSVTMLIFSYGILMGIGIGFGYCTLLMSTADAFPDKKGLTTGIMLSAYSLGSLVFAPLGRYLIDCFGVMSALKILGLAFLMIIMILSQFVTQAPDNFQIGYKKNKIQNNIDMTWRQILQSPIYYMLAGMAVIASANGLLVIGHASSIAQSLIGVSPVMAAWIVGLISIANTCGRFIGALASDYLGRSKTLMIVFMFTIILFTSLCILKSENTIIMTILLLLTGFSFGSTVGVIPAITSDIFGSTNSGTSFGLVMFGTAFGSFLGPTISSYSVNIFQSYIPAFVVAAFLGIGGLFLAWRSGIVIKRYHIDTSINKERSFK